MKKKGSLSLSMNAIVILILAITLLGLGLSFMRGLFKTMTTKVQEAVSAQELVNPPTEDNQMTVAPSEFNLKVGQPAKALIAYMSMDPESSGVSCAIDDCTCQGCGDPVPIFSDGEYNMMKGQINTWTVTVALDSDDSGEAPCTALCTCGMDCGDGAIAGKDFVVTWTD